MKLHKFRDLGLTEAWVKIAGLRGGARPPRSAGGKTNSDI